jgi:hypothetical protein
METYKSQPDLRPKKKVFKITNLRGEPEKPKPKMMATQEYIKRKKESKEYLKIMKKEFHLDEKYNNFKKLTAGLPNQQKLIAIQRLESRAKMKEDLIKAKSGVTNSKVENQNLPPKPYSKNGKGSTAATDRNTKSPAPAKKEILPEDFDQGMAEEEDIDQMYFDAITAKIGILESIKD